VYEASAPQPQHAEVRTSADRILGDRVAL